MANKNTMRARRAGYCSWKDAGSNGNKTYVGNTCDTSWQAAASKKRKAKMYGKSK